MKNCDENKEKKKEKKNTEKLRGKRITIAIIKTFLSCISFIFVSEFRYLKEVFLLFFYFTCTNELARGPHLLSNKTKKKQKKKKK